MNKFENFSFVRYLNEYETIIKFIINLKKLSHKVKLAVWIFSKTFNTTTFTRVVLNLCVSYINE